ncbi:hypothetical protein H5T54_04710 [Candidatus Bipolaricaulota bacterium]|nr:hypothetical protein [Candidatus Bipolaricaulota bacterium]
MNTEIAVRAILAEGCFKSWLPARIREAGELAEGESFRDLYSCSAPYKALAEIRAVGYLLACGCKVIPQSTQGPDVKLRLREEEVAVEISAVRMNAEEAEALYEFHNRRPDLCDELAVHPAGAPKPGELGVDNLAHKFVNKAQEENDQLPKDRPALMWLDLQFEDWWGLSPDEAWPLYVLGNGRFRTGGIWLAFYGRLGTPLLDWESIEEGLPPIARGIVHASLRYPGYFQSGEARASAVVILWPDCTLIFENPWAANPLPQPILERLLHLRRFDWPRSWLRPFWKELLEALADLQLQVCSALDEIAGVAQFARLSW